MDSTIFQWILNAFAMRYRSHGIVANGSRGANLSDIYAGTFRASQRPNARHFLSNRTAAPGPIRKQLDSHEAGIKAVDVHLCLKDVLSRIGLYLHVAKVKA